MEHRPSLRLLLVLGVLSITAILLAYFGWRGHHAPLTDAIYLAFTSIDAGVAYEEIGAKHPGDLLLEAARFLGLMVEPLVVVILFLGLFRKSLIRFGAAFKRNHLIVIGDSGFADSLSEAPNLSVIHLRSLGDDIHVSHGLIRLPFSGIDMRALSWIGAKKANAIVVAPADDRKAVDVALAAREEYPDTQVCVRARDAWLAESLRNLPGAELLSAFSEPGLAARFVVRSYPPFLIAKDGGQKRIHALLMGDEDWLEALICEMILTARTRTFGKLMFTALCADPDGFREKLQRRYPEIEAEADLHLLPAASLDRNATFAVDIARIGEPAPVTAVYILYRDDRLSLSSALSFVAQAREAGFRPPVFAVNGSQKVKRPKPGRALEANQLVLFGTNGDICAASGFLAPKNSLPERAFHEAYLKLAPDDTPASKRWEDLPEEYRVSNRRVVAHIPAKLFDAGFDLRSWMADHDIWKSLPKLVPAEVLYRDDAERERLAELEHERWIADRRISGWRYGEKRNNLRKHHPDIQPFDRLSEKVKSYDRKSVDQLQKILTRGTGSLTRLPPAG
jgi:hypothetical protein